MAEDGYDKATDKIVFLGDLIDRGPDSKGVVERVKGLVESGEAFAVAGNHESFALDHYVKGNSHAYDMWLYNGGTKALLSYSDVPGELGRMSEEHVRFLGSLPRAIELQGFFFSHAPVPREKHRNGNVGFRGEFGEKGQRYTLWELTWHYFGPEGDRPDGMMGVHEGPLSDAGKGKEHLIGVCGHIHRGLTEVRIFPRYRMLDCGSGCFPTGRLAVHECISARTMYADPKDI
jgi:hypothetical protein